MKKKIVVLMGGQSAEREVSLKSGEAVFDTISKVNDYEVIKFDLMEINSFIDFLTHNKDITVFNALHGKIGEDGRIQSVLDLYKIPYTHSGVLPSALGMNKLVSKLLAKVLNIPVANHKIVNPGDLLNIEIDYPFVIKPINEGSSIGTFIIKNLNDLKNAYASLQNFDRMMVENYIEGVECTVSVLQGKALGVTEITFNNSFYDYEAKYATGGSTHHIPPKHVTKSDCDKIKEYSENLYQAMNARGVIRADFIIGANHPIFLEVNTHPGMTQTSLLPEQANYQKINFLQLCISLIDSATFDV